jgi:hypothetical protein
VFDEDIPRPRNTTPLFHLKRTYSSGGSDEISLGPSIVALLRWAIIGVAVLKLLIVGGPDDAILTALEVCIC